MYTMKASVAVAKEADAKKGVSPTRSDKSIQRLRDESEGQIGSLRGVIANITRNGGTPSVESIAMQLSGMSMGGCAPALLALQQTHGNQYVQRVVSGIQAKLTVGQPGDNYEQEADRVAEQVMRMPEPEVQPKPTSPHSQGPSCGDEDIEETVQTKPLTDQITPLLRSEIEDEEDEKIIQNKGQTGEITKVTPDLESRINTLKGGGQPLPESVRAFFEPRFGYDFSRVRIHAGDRAADVAREVNARAFTLGWDIMFGTGQLATGTNTGQRLLAHELTHVVQQKASPFCVASNQTEGGGGMKGSVGIRRTTIVHTMPETTIAAVACPPPSPAGVTTLSDYIDLIACAENGSGYNPRNMLAMLRQLYYGKPWSATSTTSRWDNVIPCSPTLVEPRYRLNTNLYQALRQSAEVGGVDVGHVFTGLEAMTCPSSNVSFMWGAAPVAMPNEEFATWGGDLGAAAAAHVACGELGAAAINEVHCSNTAGQQPLTFYASHHAPPQDLEGDIAPFVMRANQLGISCQGSSGQQFTPSQPISQMFRQYYLNSSTSLGMTRADRSRCFLEMIGAQINNNSITNRAIILGSIVPRVASFANAFYLGIRGITHPLTPPSILQMSNNANTLVNGFLTILEGRL